MFFLVTSPAGTQTCGSTFGLGCKMAALGESAPSASLARCNAEEKKELQKMLVLACWHGEVEIVRKLAQKGFDFRICNEKYDGSGNKEVSIIIVCRKI